MSETVTTVQETIAALEAINEAHTGLCRALCELLDVVMTTDMSAEDLRRVQAWADRYRASLPAIEEG